MNTCCVLISTPESQQPKPGCEWYQPTTISGLKKKNHSLVLLHCSYYLLVKKVMHVVTHAQEWKWALVIWPKVVYRWWMVKSETTVIPFFYQHDTFLERNQDSGTALWITPRLPLLQSFTKLLFWSDILYPTVLTLLVKYKWCCCFLLMLSHFCAACSKWNPHLVILQEIYFFSDSFFQLLRHKMDNIFNWLILLLSHRPVCLSMSSILAWNTGSTASTLTPWNYQQVIDSWIYMYTVCMTTTTQASSRD